MTYNVMLYLLLINICLMFAAESEDLARQTEPCNGLFHVMSLLIHVRSTDCSLCLARVAMVHEIPLSYTQ